MLFSVTRHDVTPDTVGVLAQRSPVRYSVDDPENLANFVDRDLVKPPFLVQTVFGILGGISVHPDDVMHMKRTADRLFGTDYRWSVLGAGRGPIATMAASMGSNLRTGLESVYGSVKAGCRNLTLSKSKRRRNCYVDNSLNRGTQRTLRAETQHSAGTPVVPTSGSRLYKFRRREWLKTST